MSDLPLSDRLDQFLRGTWLGSKRIQGLQGGARAFVLARVAERIKRPLLIITANANQAENLYDDLGFFLGEERELPPFRKRGLYRAMVAARLAHARAHGIPLATSHAREATSAPILAALGFDTVCRIGVYFA